MTIWIISLEQYRGTRIILTDFTTVLVVRVTRAEEHVADRTCKVLDVVFVTYDSSASARL